MKLLYGQLLKKAFNMKNLTLASLVILFLLSATNISCSLQTKKIKLTKMEESKEIVGRQFDKWSSGEAGFFDLLADSVHWVVSGRSPVSGTYLGKKDFLERSVNPIVARLKTPLAPELISLTFDSSHVWLHFKARARTLENDVYENTYIWKMQLQDGKIIKGTAFLDTYELSILMN
jgi:ketosteroid isomerase-like protein